MSELVLTDEQAHVISSSQGYVRIYNSRGEFLGFVGRSAYSPEEIVEAEKRLDSDGPWHTTQEVLEHLRSPNRRDS